jgi:transcriptional regulator with PAS, ATPase and Fis domain
MTPLLAVLSRSDSFAEFWPRLANSANATPAIVDSMAALLALPTPCGIIIAAAGMEHQVLDDLDEIRSKFEARVCVAGVSTDHRLAIALLKSGADDYFALPGDLITMRSWAIAQSERLATAERVEAMAGRHRKRYDFSRMIGQSPCLAGALDLACKIIPRPTATILVTGETGTGKELLARAIHYNGPRATKPFVEVNCAALPDNLLESELFGYEAGAFTDARSAKPGLFEVASAGTLFLDEIGDLPFGLQGKILRVIEEKQVRRVGGLRTIDVDVRIIAATHLDLGLAVKEKRFREDLFFRLNLVPIRLPALRERADDVLILAEHFLERFGPEYERPGLSLSPDVKRALLDYDWPGNVRELRNVIERAVLLGDGPLTTGDLFSGEDPIGSGRDTLLPFPASIREIEAAAARAAVDRSGGNKTRAAAMLKISRKYLYELLNDAEVARAGA